MFRPESLVGRKPTPYIIVWAIAVHLVWGIALLTDPGVVSAIILVGLHWLIALGVDGPQLGLALIIAAGAAVVSLALGTRLSNLVSFLLLMPQYAILVAAFVSDAQSIVTGSVSPGRDVDRLLLFTALWPTMAAAALHSAAIIERHWTWKH